MSLKPSNGFLLKIDQGNGQFQPVRGLILKEINFQSETHDQSALTQSPWRHLLGGAALRSLSVLADGLVVDEVVQEILRQAYFDQSLNLWEVEIKGIGRFNGPLILKKLSIIGSIDQELKFNLSLDSAGPINFTNALGG